jgi:SAM-dependent methyltransferase
MGIEIWAFRNLVEYRSSFNKGGDCVMLGRQGMHIMGPPYNKDNKVEECLKKHSLSPPAPDLLKGYAENFFKWLGASNIYSLDYSSYEGATILHDLNVPIADDLRDRFDVIFDGGTLEHVYEFPTAVRNCRQMLKPGGLFVSVSVANNFLGHGFYQFSPELMWRQFGREQGFEMLKLGITHGPDVFQDIPDPAEVGHRIEMGVTLTPNYIVTVSRKVGDSHSDVLQSDYAKIWKGTDSSTK